MSSARTAPSTRTSSSRASLSSSPGCPCSRASSGRSPRSTTRMAPRTPGSATSRGSPFSSWGAGSRGERSGWARSSCSPPRRTRRWGRGSISSGADPAGHHPGLRPGHEQRPDQPRRRQALRGPVECQPAGDGVSAMDVTAVQGLRDSTQRRLPPAGAVLEAVAAGVRQRGRPRCRSRGSKYVAHVAMFRTCPE